MTKTLYSLLFYIISLSAFAQHPACDGNRYRNFAFAAVDSAINVQFGHNTTMNHVAMNLFMDIYQPTPDPAIKRPLIVFIHGGGFVAGSRKDMTGISILFAAEGFVTATIDYRLIDIPPVDSQTVAEGIIQAMGDANAAVRFFVEDAATGNTYKIDTNYIFISGSSAGGVTAAHVAYLDTTDNIPPYFSSLIASNGGFEGNSSANTNYSAHIKGVLNYSGALWRKEWISYGEPPLYSFHDAQDTIVPCGHGIPKAFPFALYVDGSCAMQQEADLKGIYNGIFIYPGSGHGGYFNSHPTVDTVFKRSSDFLYNIICTDILSINEPENSISKILVYPNPAQNNFTIELPLQNVTLEIYDVTGRKILSQQNISDRTQIDCSRFIDGVYFIQTFNEKSRFYQKLTIAK